MSAVARPSVAPARKTTTRRFRRADRRSSRREGCRASQLRRGAKPHRWRCGGKARPRGAARTSAARARAGTPKSRAAGAIRRSSRRRRSTQWGNAVTSGSVDETLDGSTPTQDIPIVLNGTVRYAGSIDHVRRVVATVLQVKSWASRTCPESTPSMIVGTPKCPGVE